MVYFSCNIFSDHKKNPGLPLVSLKFEETMTSPKLFNKDIMEKTLDSAS